MRKLHFASLAFIVGCASASHDVIHPIGQPEARVASPVARAAPVASVAPQQTDAMLEWLRAKLPKGGSAKRDDKGAIVVTHEAGAKDTIGSVAGAYLDFTTTYLVSDFVKRIAS